MLSLALHQWVYELISSSPFCSGLGHQRGTAGTRTAINRLGPRESCCINVIYRVGSERYGGITGRETGNETAPGLICNSLCRRHRHRHLLFVRNRDNVAAAEARGIRIAWIGKSHQESPLILMWTVVIGVCVGERVWTQATRPLSGCAYQVGELLDWQSGGSEKTRNYDVDNRHMCMRRCRCTSRLLFQNYLSAPGHFDSPRFLLCTE
jgi:hypothetical protein